MMAVNSDQASESLCGVLRLEGGTYRSRTRNECGIGLLEVLIAALIVGMGALGLSLLLNRGYSDVVAEGTNRVAFNLAQQKIEKLKGLGFALTLVGNGTTASCGAAPPNDEPCYQETLSAGIGRQNPGSAQLDTQTFSRLTCVRYVKDDNPEDPAETSPPTCPSCSPTPAPNHCTRQTKRIRVTVTATSAGGQAVVTADPVTLETLLTSPE